MSENKIDNTVILNSSLSYEAPTVSLRFVERDGRRILQQAWRVERSTGVCVQWRDIPLVAE